MKLFTLVPFLFLSVTHASPELQQRLQTVREELKAANQDLTCFTLEDCFTLPAGARACGGPSYYEVVSKLNPQLEKVRSLATETETIEKKLNENNDVESICTVLAAPKVECAKASCQKIMDAELNP